MFYLLIALRPFNAIQTVNVWLYVAMLFYWVFIAVPQPTVDNLP